MAGHMTNDAWPVAAMDLCVNLEGVGNNSEPLTVFSYFSSSYIGAYLTIYFYCISFDAFVIASRMFC